MVRDRYYINGREVGEQEAERTGIKAMAEPESKR